MSTVLTIALLQLAASSIEAPKVAALMPRSVGFSSASFVTGGDEPLRLPAALTLDLGQERAEFERLSRNRNIGISLVAGAGIAAVASAAGFITSGVSRSELLLQRVPVNLDDRQTLLDVGRAGTGVGYGGVALAAALGVVSIFFLSASF